MGVFFDVQSDLPRQAPGDGDSTRRALASCDPLPAKPRVLDIGCGPGAQTLVLAERLKAASITGSGRRSLGSCDRGEPAHGGDRLRAEDVYTQHNKDYAGIDIFRLDDHGRVVEHWDVLQVVPEKSANDNTMF